MKERILVTLPVQEQHKQLLESIAPDSEFIYIPRGKVTEEDVQAADIIIGNCPPAMIKGSPRLKWLQLNSAGANGYTDPGVLPEGAYLTNGTGAYGLALSEHLLGMLLVLMKKLNAYQEDQKAHIWGDHGTVTSIWGSKTLVVGLGDIGGEFAKRMHALGSSVIGIKRTPGEKPDYLEALYQMDALADCLKEADIVCLSLPGTGATRHTINKEMLSLMKPTAILLNIGRGTAIDTDALIEALQNGTIAGAAMDVTDPEPLPADHPLWDASNVLITPHISGQYHLPETFEHIVRIAADNLRRYKAGEPLANQVDFATGYRRS